MGGPALIGAAPPSQPRPGRLDHLWRLLATAFCFSLFGVGAVVLWAILFPLVAPFLGRGIAKKRRSRRLMHEVFRVFVAVMRGCGLLDYEAHNPEPLNRPGQLVISNHPSLIDVVLLISMIRNATCVVKPALARNPVMRAPIRAMGYLYAEDPETLLDRCAEELREGCSLIVFPEGSRTPPDQRLRPFQRGAANIALKSGAAILPVCIRSHPAWLTKQQPWYYVPPTRTYYRFEVGEALAPGGMVGGLERSVASRRLTRYLEGYFRERVEAGA
ncbi:lysophospholipid acyltransferase family protein [Methylomagnum sp.]